MRLFVAILLEKNMISALKDAQKALRSRRFSGYETKEQNLHLTLSFIGEYADPEAVLTQMTRIRQRQFPLALSGCIGNFGDLLWAGTDETEALSSCVRQLRHFLAESQIPFDKKRFHPHITLLRNAKSSAPFADIQIARAQMTVRRISLMRSDFGKHGVAYTEIGFTELDAAED